MADQKEINLIEAIVKLALDAQRNQSREAIKRLNLLPQTPEVRQLAARLHECDRKIEAQCRLILKADMIARKVAILN